MFHDEVLRILRSLRYKFWIWLQVVDQNPRRTLFHPISLCVLYKVVNIVTFGWWSRSGRGLSGDLTACIRSVLRSGCVWMSASVCHKESMASFLWRVAEWDGQQYMCAWVSFAVLHKGHGVSFFKNVSSRALVNAHRYTNFDLVALAFLDSQSFIASMLA